MSIALNGESSSDIVFGAFFSDTGEIERHQRDQQDRQRQRDDDQPLERQGAVAPEAQQRLV